MKGKITTFHHVASMLKNELYLRDTQFHKNLHTRRQVTETLTSQLDTIYFLILEYREWTNTYYKDVPSSQPKGGERATSFKGLDSSTKNLLEKLSILRLRSSF